MASQTSVSASSSHNNLPTPSPSNAPRQRTSPLGGGASSLTNSTVNPFVNMFSATHYRLPSNVMTSMTGRGPNSGRRTSNSGILEDNAPLLESSSATNSASNIEISTAVPTREEADGNNVEVEVSNTAPPQWNNLSSMVNSITPLIPNTAAFQRAARRVICGRNVPRTVGNRRPNSIPVNRTAMSAVEMQNVAAILAALEEPAEDDATTNNNNNSTTSSRRNTYSSNIRNSTDSLADSNQTDNQQMRSTEPTPSTSGTSRHDMRSSKANLVSSSEINLTDVLDAAAAPKRSEGETASPVVPEARSVEHNEETGRPPDDSSSDNPNRNEASDEQLNNNNESNENSGEDEDNADDPYWSGVLWQIPVLCLVLFCKFLQHYIIDICEVLIVICIFHIYNMVVRNNVVSHKSITIGWRQCISLMFDRMKKSVRHLCTRRSILPGQVGGREALSAGASLESNPQTTTEDVSVVIRQPNNPSTSEVDGVLTLREDGNAPRVNSEEKKINPLCDEKTASPGEPQVVLHLGNEGSAEDDRDRQIKVGFTKAPEEVSDAESESSCVVQVNPNYRAADEQPEWHQETASSSHPLVTNKRPDSVVINIENDSEENTSSPQLQQTPQDLEATIKTGTIDSGESNIATTIAPETNSTTGTESPRDDNTTTTTTTTTVVNVDTAGVNEVAAPPAAGGANRLLESLEISEEEQQAQESVMCVIERIKLLLLTLATVPLTVYLFYWVVWSDYAVYKCLLFLPPTVSPFLLTQVLWLTFVLDYLARLCTAWLKGWMVILRWMQRSPSLINKGKYYPVIEMISQLYRSLLPIVPWFFYIYASYAYYAQESNPVQHHNVRAINTPAQDSSSESFLKTLLEICANYKVTQTNTSTTSSPAINLTESAITHLLHATSTGFPSTSTPGEETTTTTLLPQVVSADSTYDSSSLSEPPGISAHQLMGLALFLAYLLHKKLDIVARGSNLWHAIKALRNNTGSYGTEPSKCELESSGGKCPICHDSFRVPILLKCSHIFCESCIVQWFQRERICPMCRAQIADDPVWKDGSTSQLFQII